MHAAAEQAAAAVACLECSQRKDAAGPETGAADREKRAVGPGKVAAVRDKDAAGRERGVAGRDQS